MSLETVKGGAIYIRINRTVGYGRSAFTPCMQISPPIRRGRAVRWHLTSNSTAATLRVVVCQKSGASSAVEKLHGPHRVRSRGFVTFLPCHTPAWSSLEAGKRNLYKKYLALLYLCIRYLMYLRKQRSWWNQASNERSTRARNCSWCETQRSTATVVDNYYQFVRGVLLSTLLQSSNANRWELSTA